MSDENTTAEAELRPVRGEPSCWHEWDENDRGDLVATDPSVGWDLSWGCNLTFGYEGDDLHVTISMSDEDLANGITNRSVTREQLAEYARYLLLLAEDKCLSCAQDGRPGSHHRQTCDFYVAAPVETRIPGVGDTVSFAVSDQADDVTGLITAIAPCQAATDPVATIVYGDGKEAHQHLRFLTVVAVA